MKRNITVTLDEDTLRAAKLAAARRGISLSALLRAEIERIAEVDERYEAARRAAFEWLERGRSLGGTRPAARDKLHDRDALR